MSLFKIDNIIPNNKTNVIDINKISSKELDEDYSFNNETYNFLLSYNRDYNNATKKFYKNILESYDDTTIISESFNDFFNKAKEIIKKFLEFIKSLFAKFVGKMHSLFKSEQYLIKNKNEFSKFSSEDEFSFEGYNFTHLDDNAVPSIDPFPPFIEKGQYRSNSYSDTAFDNDDNNYDLSTEYNAYDTATDDSDKATKLGAYEKKQNQILEKVTKQYDALIDYLDEFYDSFRAETIGQKGESISQSDFSEELFRKFRDDSAIKITITADSTFISDAYRRFADYNNLIKVVERAKQRIEREYDKIQKALDRSAKFEKDGNGVFFSFDTGGSSGLAKFGSSDKVRTTAEINNKIELYIKAKVGQIQQMSSIHSSAFSAKITAIKDCFVQDKSVLYKALAKIKGHLSNN